MADEHDDWLVTLGVSEQSFDNRSDDRGDTGQSGGGGGDSGGAGDNRPSQSGDASEGGDSFSPEAVFNQTLESSGYELGSDPCLDKCWEAFRRCLRSSNNSQKCIADLSVCQRSCAAASAQSSGNELGSPSQSVDSDEGQTQSQDQGGSGSRNLLASQDQNLDQGGGGGSSESGGGDGNGDEDPIPAGPVVVDEAAEVEAALDAKGLMKASGEVAPLLTTARVPDDAKVFTKITVSKAFNVTITVTVEPDNPANKAAAGRLAGLLNQKFAGRMKTAISERFKNKNISLTDTVELKWVKFE